MSTILTYSPIPQQNPVEIPERTHLSSFFWFSWPLLLLLLIVSPIRAVGQESITKTVVADGTHYNSNPWMIIDPLGRIQVFYRQGTMNTNSSSDLFKRAVSTDNGTTWTISTFTAPSAPAGNYPNWCHVTLMSNGIVAASAVMYNIGGGAPLDHVYFQTSNDYGDTWSGWTEIPYTPFYLGSSSHGPVASSMMEGKNGEILMCVEGLLSSSDTRTSVVLYRSYDLGATWTFSTIATNPTVRNYNETKLQYISGGTNGELIAFIRSDSLMYRATSMDDGNTWTTPVADNPSNYLPGFPDVLIVNDVTHLWYRSTVGTGGAGDTSEAISYDYGVTWSPHYTVYDGRYEYSQTITQGNTAISAIAVSTVNGGNGTVANVYLLTWTPLSLSGVVSEKVHTGVGNFDVNLPLTGTRGVECRTPGNLPNGATGDYQLIFTFSNNLQSVGSVNVTGTASVGSSAMGPNPNQYTVNLTTVSDAQYVQVNLSNVTDTLGNTASISSPQMGVLIGDVNASGGVDGNDVAAVQAHTRQAVDSNAQARFDVNANGTIDGNDVSTTQGQTRTSLPSSPAQTAAPTPKSEWLNREDVRRK
jgi:hypothetical protein